MKRKKIVISITLALSMAQTPAFAQFESVFELSDLNVQNSQNGFILNGILVNDFSGSSVCAAGDFNGDGIDDLIIGAPGVNDADYNRVGSSYVVFGSDSGFSNPINLSTINGQNGVTLNGLAEYAQSGYSVSSAGDINGDGIDDLIVGTFYAGITLSYAGSSYVVFGSDSGLPNPIDLSSLNGVNGFAINGASGSDQAGRSVSAAGDINGDGIDDVIIGAYSASPGGVNRAGSSYVVFGSDNGFPNPFDLANINGINGFALNGVAAGDRSGGSVSTAGDFNGDGIDDLIIGAYEASPDGRSGAGSSYVVFGTDSQIPNPFNLSTLNGLNGFTINGVSAEDESGHSVGAAGDFNGDGIDDVIIGAIGTVSGGSSYVLFGSKSVMPNPFELSAINGLNGIVINGTAAGDRLGVSVSAAGDINHDGVADIIIGADEADPGGRTGAGSSYVLFGTDSQLPNPFNLSTLNGVNGFTLNGEGINDRSGGSVSSAGDVNSDGIDDLIIGAERSSPNGVTRAGSSYLVFGKEKPIFENGFE